MAFFHPDVLGLGEREEQVPPHFIKTYLIIQTNIVMDEHAAGYGHDKAESLMSATADYVKENLTRYDAWEFVKP